MSGEARGVGPTSLRALLSVAEPAYATVMRARNALYQSGLKRSHKLAQPVISVGNLTAGGTGKTPVVRWLATQLAELKPAILMRGYRAEQTGVSDEAAMLQSQLADIVTVEAQRDRFAGAAAVLSRRPETRVFLLDDGFQHRRVKRDFDLVLINALEPFGYGHVHPRGLLREPLAGLKRASAFIITRVDQATPDDVTRIESHLRRYNTAAPIFHASHKLTSLVDASDTSQPIETLRGKRVFAFCGIGSPQAFFTALRSHTDLVGEHAFPDHAAYARDDIAALASAAKTSGADLLVTTEKDWSKLKSLPEANASIPPIARVDMDIRFRADDGERLLSLIRSKLPARSPL